MNAVDQVVVLSNTREYSFFTYLKMGNIGESTHHTTWTINIQVNSEAVHDTNFGSNGTWENPIGGDLDGFWAANTCITITNSSGDQPRILKGHTFELEVKQQDTMRWVISEMSPFVTENYGIALYGFNMGAYWDKVMRHPSAQQKKLGMASVIHRFNAPKPPDLKWLNIGGGLMAFPTADVKRNAKAGRV